MQCYAALLTAAVLCNAMQCYAYQINTQHTSYLVAELGHAYHLPLAVLDGETEHVPGPEASVLVHIAEKLWVLVSVLDVDQLARLGHQAGYALAYFDLYGFLRRGDNMTSVKMTPHEKLNL